MLKAPIAIIAFNRPHYLRRTLESLAYQTHHALNGREVHLFQDGGVNPLSGRRYASEELIDKNIWQFLYFVPKGIVHRQRENIGIARHFDFVERFFFEELACQAAIFFEDDMVVSPYYLSIIDQMIAAALVNEQIGYVAAYGDHRAPLASQSRNSSKIIEMEHKWAFGLTRRQWLRQKSLVSEYLKLIDDTDYQQRDHKKIVTWMISKGFVSQGTSQDGIKDIAMFLSGATKMMTYCCFGKYIGRRGVHATDAFYRANGYGKTLLCPSPPSAFSWPSENEMACIVQNGRQSMKDNLQRIKKLYPYLSLPTAVPHAE